MSLQTYSNTLLVDEYKLESHECNEEDWKDFYKSRKSNEKVFEKIKEKSGFYCIDSQEELVIRGQNVDYVSLNIYLVACTDES